MTTKTLLGLLCGALFVLSTGCADQEGAASSSGEADLSATEANLIASDSSLAGSQEQAQACFDEMKACKDAGEDKATCLEQLRSCLPTEPAAPTECGAKGPRGHGKGKNGPPPGGAGGAPPEPPPGAPDCDLPPPPDGSQPPPPDGGAGAPPQGDGAGQPPPGPPPGGADGAPPQGKPGGKKGPPPGACAPPDVPPEEMKGCHDQLGASLEQGGDEEAAMTEHKGCMKKAFKKHKKPLCEAGMSECATDGAPADTCSKIQQCCSDEG